MMPDMLSSKTIIGFLILLASIIGLAIANKLTPEAVDAIKWLGASFMAVRTAANIAENISNKPPQDPKE